MERQDGLPAVPSHHRPTQACTQADTCCGPQRSRGSHMEQAFCAGVSGEAPRALRSLVDVTSPAEEGGPPYKAPVSHLAEEHALPPTEWVQEQTGSHVST